MEALFRTVLGMSAAAAAAVLVVLLVRLPLRRAPKIFSYVLWAVVLFRLLCPFTLESAFGLFPAVGTASAGERQSEALYTAIPPADKRSEGDWHTAASPSSVPAVLTPPELPARRTDSIDWMAAACGIWLAGAAALLAYSAVSLLRLRRRLVGAVPLRGTGRVWLADRIPSPFVLGLLRPRIYLPSRLPEEERDYIILHERTHIRRGDHIFRALAWLALALHWFNPLVWLAFHLAGRDMEMSCDEAVLRRMGRDIRADYSASLLRLSVGKRLPAGPLAFGSGDLKSRIKNVLNYKKPTLWVIAAALIAVAITGAALVTSRTAGGPGPMDPQPPETWLDFYDMEGFPWDDSAGIQLPEYPGVSFYWTPGEVTAEESGRESGLFSGMPIWNVFLCDLTGDGLRELCATVSWGSGMIDEHVIVYDYAGGAEYTLWDRGEYDYVLSMENGQLQVTKLEYGGQAIAVGTLVLRGDGRLEIADEVPVAAQPPEAPIAVDTTDAPAAGAEPVPAPVLDLAPVYALDDLGVSVAITGLDCDGARWYARSLNAAFEPPEKALGYLELWEPRFLGEAFSEAYVSVIALYSPEEDADLIRLNLNGRRESRYTYCTVNLTTGAVTDNQIPGWDTVSTSLSEQEMLPAARALAELIQGASDHYAAATDVHEEGPLPFDKPMKLWFGSGAGGWCTILTLHPDGSFEGDYHDSDMGAGDMYVCLFHGRFEDITQASAASWTMTLKELVLDTGREVGEVWYEDGIRYTATSPYGFDGNDGQALEPGAQFIFYTPDAAGHAPGTELYGLYETADFWGWWPERHAFRSADDTLGCYGLRNVETGYGFFDLYVWGLL